MAHCKLRAICKERKLATGFVPTRRLVETLEALYERRNRRKFVHPDPLEFLYRYEDVRDREVAGFVASSLAYGRVGQILKSVSRVLGRMDPSPSRFLEGQSRKTLRRAFANFKHRFTTGEELAATLWGIKRVVERYGSLGACFAAHMGPDDDTILQALCAFVADLGEGVQGQTGVLLAPPSGASACKKLHLFLRWMVRHDDVDPGGWEWVAPSRLIVPLDIHMHRVGLRLGMTERKQADMRAALEITAAFRRIVPEDPVRYDFVLTRSGIWGNMGVGGLRSEWSIESESEEVR
jgi:uncharacterized protein (TIGR02757 family)